MQITEVSSLYSFSIHTYPGEASIDSNHIMADVTSSVDEETEIDLIILACQAAIKHSRHPSFPISVKEIHKVMLVKIFCAKHDLLPDLSPFRFIQILHCGTI